MKLSALLHSKIFFASLIAIAATVIATAVIINKQAEGNQLYRSVKIYDIIGSGNVMRGKVGDIAPYKGMNLESGDSLFTYDESNIRLNMDEDKSMLVESNTEIWLVASGDPDNNLTRITVRSGAVLSEITKPLSEGSTYEVLSPKAAMSVRGTSFRVSVLKDYKGNYITTLHVYHGTVRVQLLDEDENPKGKSVDVGEDKCVIIETVPNAESGQDAFIDGNSFFVFSDSLGGYELIRENEDPITEIEYSDIPYNTLAEIYETDRSDEIVLFDDVLEKVVAAMNAGGGIGGAETSVNTSGTEETPESVTTVETEPPETEPTITTVTSPADTDIYTGEPSLITDGVDMDALPVNNGEPGAAGGHGVTDEPVVTGVDYTADEPAVTTAPVSETAETTDIVQMTLLEGSAVTTASEETQPSAGTTAEKPTVTTVPEDKEEPSGMSSVSASDKQTEAADAPKKETSVTTTAAPDKTTAAASTTAPEKETSGTPSAGAPVTYAPSNGQPSVYTGAPSGYSVTSSATAAPQYETASPGTTSGTQASSSAVPVSSSAETTSSSDPTDPVTPSYDTFTVTFDSKGGTSVPSQTVKAGDPAVRPSAPTKSGYRFLAWERSDGTSYAFGTPVTSDITLVAVWAEESSSSVCYVLFEDSLTGFEKKVPVTYGETVSPITLPAQSGYTFVGWVYANGTEYDFSSPVTTDTELYARWDTESSTLFKVIFEDSMSGLEKTMTVSSGDIITPPTVPTQPGYIFNGWETYTPSGYVTFDFSQPITKDYVFLASWVEDTSEDMCTVTFMVDGAVWGTQGIAKGGYAAEPVSSPYKAGYSGYWELGEDTYWFEGTPVTTDITLVWAWIPDSHPEYCYVTLDLQGGHFTFSGMSDSMQLPYGEKLSELPEPVKDGYSFGYWKSSLTGGPYSFDDPVTADLVLTAVWYDY